MDQPYQATERERTTWRSDAEQQSLGPSARWRRKLGIALAIFAGVGVIGAGIAYWLNAQNFATTDDAFVDGYVTQMAPRVAGQVTAMQFTDNQHVTQGEALLLIDPRDYEVRLEQAQAQLANARAAAQQAKAQLGVQRADLDQSRANVQLADAELLQAKQDYDRFTSINPHAVSRQQVDNASWMRRARRWRGRARRSRQRTPS